MQTAEIDVLNLCISAIFRAQLEVPDFQKTLRTWLDGQSDALPKCCEFIRSNDGKCIYDIVKTSLFKILLQENAEILSFNKHVIQFIAPTNATISRISRLVFAEVELIRY